RAFKPFAASARAAPPGIPVQSNRARNSSHSQEAAAAAKAEAASSQQSHQREREGPRPGQRQRGKIAKPKATTTAIGEAAGPAPEGDAVMAATQNSLPNGNGSGGPQDQNQEPGQQEHEDRGDAGDDVATDAGASSLPPSEIGDGGAASSLAGGIVGPPSPLTGCYLLIVLGEPHSEEHKDNILQHLLKDT
ncbi:hypothetical protein M5D96_013406, partial [Drosophila gunungcola]